MVVAFPQPDKGPPPPGLLKFASGINSLSVEPPDATENEVPFDLALAGEDHFPVPLMSIGVIIAVEFRAASCVPLILAQPGCVASQYSTPVFGSQYECVDGSQNVFGAAVPFQSIRG